MTKEQAYEKLELPVGADLQVVRQKFQQMHNEFQVQIDGAFREDMRQKLQTRLMELEEAYKLLIGSEKMDDSGSLPHTEQTFEQKRTEEAKAQATPQTLQQALALFGLTEHQDVAQIEQYIASHIANLQQQLSTSPLQTVKDAYQVEIDKAASAKVLVNDWLQKREEERNRLESEEKQRLESQRRQEEERRLWEEREELAAERKQFEIERQRAEEEKRKQEKSKPQQPKEFVKEAKQDDPRPQETDTKSGVRRYVGIVALFIVVAVGGYYFINNVGSSNKTVIDIDDLRQDSIVWQTAVSVDSKTAYKHYLNKYPEGIFAQAATDSLLQIESRVSPQTEAIVQKEHLETKTQNETLLPASTAKNENKPKVSINTNWRSKYDEIGDFEEGLAVVKLNGKYGRIDETGKEIIAPKYSAMNVFREGLSGMALNEKWGFVDTKGKEIIPFIYDMAGIFREGLAAVKLNEKVGYIDRTGKEVIPFKYSVAENFKGGLAIVQLNGKWGAIDKTGKVVIPIKYESSLRFEGDGISVTKLNGKYGHIDKTGKEVTPFIYDGALWFNEGLASVRLNGKRGYIDKTGKEVIPIKYDNVSMIFSEGLAGVELNEKWGFVDKTGKEVIPIKYDMVGIFREGLSRVELNGKEFFIDKQGKCIKDCPD